MPVIWSPVFSRHFVEHDYPFHRLKQAAARVPHTNRVGFISLACSLACCVITGRWQWRVLFSTAQGSAMCIYRPWIAPYSESLPPSLPLPPFLPPPPSPPLGSCHWRGYAFYNSSKIYGIVSTKCKRISRGIHFNSTGWRQYDSFSIQHSNGHRHKSPAIACFTFYTTVSPLRRKYMEERRERVIRLSSDSTSIL